MDPRRLRYITALSEATGALHFSLPELQTGEALVERISDEVLAPTLGMLYAKKLIAHALRWGDVTATVEAIQWDRWLPAGSPSANSLWQRKRLAAKQRKEPVWIPVSRPEPQFLPKAVLTADGWIPFEDEYVPRVVAGEMPTDADGEAKAALAIAARTYVARAMRDHPALGRIAPIPSGTGFQVMAKSADAGARAAAARTRGEVILHEGRLILANHCAGAFLNADGSPGKDPTGTQKWVTHNGGLGGSAVHPTGLALKTHPGNRGCLSQNGAIWLAAHGVDPRSILRFYYGEDIEIRRMDDAPRQPGGAASVSPLAGPVGAVLLAAIGWVINGR